MNETYKTRSVELLVFWQRFLKNPAGIGSLIPSSRFLARKVAGSVKWEGCEVIVELGAGTGSFTKLLMAGKPRHTQVILFEKDPVLRVQLRKKFRGIPLYDDAVFLKEALCAEGVSQVNCVVSGLPFAMFSHDRRRQILAQVRQMLSADGQFITFQYTPQMYRELCRSFSKVEIRFTLFNIPPAIIYICRP